MSMLKNAEQRSAMAAKKDERGRSTGNAGIRGRKARGSRKYSAPSGPSFGERSRASDLCETAATNRIHVT